MNQFARLFILLFCVIISTVSNGQVETIKTYSVKEFKLSEGDLTASINEKCDSLGKPCALIKMRIPNNQVNFYNVESMNYESNEYQIYISNSVASFEIFPIFGFPMRVTFADYGFEHLEKKATYILTMELSKEDSIRRASPDNRYNQISLKELNEKVDSNDGEALEELGMRYMMGQGVEKDSLKGYSYFVKSAERGYVPAFIDLSDCFRHGCAVKQDGRQAFSWLEKATKKGLARGWYAMGMAYEDGIGVEKDDSKALACYKKAADSGDSEGMFELGLCYYKGKGVVQDFVMAHDLFLKASLTGNCLAQGLIGLFYIEGEGVEVNYPYALFWINLAVENDNDAAQNLLGELYYYGKGVKQDYALAFMNFRLSAENGNGDAQYNLANCYLNGQGVSKSMDYAIFWMKKASANGNEDATKMLGKMLSSSKK